MSEENNTGTESEGIKSLREGLEKSNKQNAELLAALQGYKDKDRASSVSSFLDGKGLNVKAAKLYTGEDTSEEALTKWLEEYADVFNPAAAAESDANALAAARIAGASHGSTDNATDAKVRPGQSVAIGDASEALHLMNTLPREELQRMGWLPANQSVF